jgi:hypothetical protein
MTSRKSRAINLPMKESELHQSVAELLDWILIPPAIFTTFPAGWGRLSTGTAGRLKASGLKSGMPDIFVFAAVGDPPHPRRSKVIGIELKTGRGSLTSAQRSMHAKLYAVGIRVYVCHTVSEVILALRDAGIPARIAKDPMGDMHVQSYGAVGGLGTVLGTR